MNIKKINIIFAIITVVIFAAGGVIVWQRSQTSAQNVANKQKRTNLYQLELSIPSMYCAGCTASVENYVSIVPGVISVTARLTPTKSATIIYDPALLTPEQILTNEVFTIYTDAKIISNQPFTN